MDLYQGEKERIFAIAEKARRAELRRALADKNIWKRQLIISIREIFHFTVGSLLIPSVILYAIGLPPMFGAMIALMVLGFQFAFRRKLPFTNLFTSLANEAWEQAFRVEVKNIVHHNASLSA